MASEDDNGQDSTNEQSSGRGPLWAAAVFAAGAGAAIAVKALVDSRRGSKPRGSGDGDVTEQAQEDLPSVLRRAALDVALAATTKAAQRLDTQDERERSGAAQQTLERS
jgi:hypothetical protein